VINGWKDLYPLIIMPHTNTLTSFWQLITILSPLFEQLIYYCTLLIKILASNNFRWYVVYCWLVRPNPDYSNPSLSEPAETQTLNTWPQEIWMALTIKIETEHWHLIMNYSLYSNMPTTFTTLKWFSSSEHPSILETGAQFLLPLIKTLIPSNEMMIDASTLLLISISYCSTRLTHPSNYEHFYKTQDWSRTPT
jgi:hypothetical protein